MLVDLAIYIFSLLINVIAFFLPVFDVWPSTLLTGLEYFTQSLAKFNFILPVDTLFSALTFLITFETFYFSTKILLMFVGFFRKSSALKI